MIYTHDIPISDAVYARLKRQAHATHTSVQTVIGQALERVLPFNSEDTLPPLLKAELEAMAHLSDESLWALASSRLTPMQKETLGNLNEAAQFRLLTETEAAEQSQLLAAWESVLVRRAHAAVLLQERGHDVSDPQVFTAG